MQVNLPGPIEFERYGIHNVNGIQDLDRAKGLKVLFENGPNDNNVEELKVSFRSEYFNASEGRKVEIRAVLKTLNQKFPPPIVSDSSVRSVGDIITPSGTSR